MPSFAGYDFDFGIQIPNAPNWTLLTTTETGGAGDTGTSVRLGIAFPFKDQEIEDDVYTRTYFDGKMEFNFDTSTDGTSNFSNYNFHC